MFLSAVLCVCVCVRVCFIMCFDCLGVYKGPSILEAGIYLRPGVY